MSLELASVTDSIIDMAEEVSKAIGYTVYTDGNDPRFPASIGTYHPEPGRCPRVMVLCPRSLLIKGDNWYMDLTSDSTYQSWMIYTAGNIDELADKIEPLLAWEDGLWPSIKRAWADMLRTRSVSMANPLVSPRTQTHTPQAGPSHDGASDTSTDRILESKPRFGDLSSGAKPTSNRKKTAASSRWMS